MSHNYNFNLTLSFGEILSYSFDFVKKNLSYLIKIFMIFIIPSLILLIFSMMNLIEFNKLIHTLSDEQINSSKEVLIHFITFLSLLLLLFLINIYLKKIIIQSAKTFILKEYLSIEKTMHDSLKGFFHIIITGIIGNIMILLGLFLFIIPGLIITVLLIYLPQVSEIDNINYFSGIGKSIIFSAKTFWGIFLISFFLYSLFIVLIMFFMAFFSSGLFDLIFKRENLGFNTTFILIQFGLFYIFYILFYIFIQIMVTLKYINIKTMEDGMIKR